MSSRIPLTLTGVFFFATACGGGGAPTPKIQDVEITFDNGGSLAVDLYEVEYKSDGRLDDVTYTREGELEGVTIFTYSKSKIDNVEREDYSAGIASDYIEYLDVTYDKQDRVDEFRFTNSTDADYFGEFSYSYDSESRVSERELLISTDDDIETTEYDYDSQSRLDEIAVTSTNGYSHRSEIEWADNNNVKKVTSSSSGNSTTYSYKHDDEDRITRITQGSVTTEIDYRDDGLVDSITSRYSSGGSTSTTIIEYTYKTGDVVGIMPTPAFDYSELFQMDGYAQSEYPVLTTSFFFGN